MRYQSVVPKAGACVGTATMAWLTLHDRNTPVVLGRGRTLKSMLKVGFALRPPMSASGLTLKGKFWLCCPSRYTGHKRVATSGLISTQSGSVASPCCRLPFKGALSTVDRVGLGMPDSSGDLCNTPAVGTVVRGPQTPCCVLVWSRSGASRPLRVPCGCSQAPSSPDVRLADEPAAALPGSGEALALRGGCSAGQVSLRA